MCTQIEEYENDLENAPFFSLHKERASRDEQNKLILFNKIATLLQNLIEIESEKNQKNELKIFDLDFTPSISIIDYLKRIDMYLKFNEEFYYCALIYIDRFIEKTQFQLDFKNVYKYYSFFFAYSPFHLAL